MSDTRAGRAQGEARARGLPRRRAAAQKEQRAPACEPRGPPSAPARRGAGTRTPARTEDAPAAAPHLPRSARPRRRLAPPPPRPPEPRAPPALGQIQRRRARGRGPPRGRERARGGGVRQVLQLPSLPPAGRGGGGGGRRRARSANEFTFCPPRAPPPLPAGLLLGRRGPAGAVGSRRGSRRTAEGEQGGKERRRAGRRARSAIQDLKGALAGAQGRVCPRDQARTRVRV